MRTVIWTDVMQFFLFVGAGLFSLFWIVFQLDGGWTQMAEVSSEKFTLFNLTTDPAVGFTLWVACWLFPFRILVPLGSINSMLRECFAVGTPEMPARQ